VVRAQVRGAAERRRGEVAGGAGRDRRPGPDRPGLLARRAGPGQGPARAGRAGRRGGARPAVTDDRWLPPRAPPTHPPPTPQADGAGSGRTPLREREGLVGKLAAPLVALLAFLSKIKVVLLALAKVKFLVTSSSMLVSIVAYASIWGWKFGVG